VSFENHIKYCQSVAGESGLWLGSAEAYYSALGRMPEPGQEPSASAVYTGEEDEEESPYKEYSYMVQDLDDGVVGIHVRGQLVTSTAWYNRYVGMVSYEEIINALSVAANTNPSDIVMMYKSPGGAAQGISEASDHIKAVQDSGINVYSHTGSIMASGAYWLGVTANEVWATSMAEVGSVGVISVHMEYTKMLEKMGISTKVMRTAEFKALGSPFEKVTEKFLKHHQERLETTHNLFVEHVASERNLSVEDTSANIANGKVFMGREAAAINAIDTVGTLDGLVQKIISGRPSVSYPRVDGDNQMKRRILSQGEQDRVSAAVAAGVSREDAVTAVVSEGAGAAVDTSDDGDNPAPQVDDATGGDAPGDDGKNVEVNDDAGANDDAGGKDDAGVNPALVALSAQVQVLQDKVVDLSVEKAGLQNKLDGVSSAVPALTKFAVSVLSRMEIGLGRATTPTEGMDPVALANLCASVNDEFCSQYKVGSKTYSGNPTEGGNVTAAPVTPMQTHLANVTRIGGNK